MNQIIRDLMKPYPLLLEQLKGFLPEFVSIFYFNGLPKQRDTQEQRQTTGLQMKGKKTLKVSLTLLIFPLAVRAREGAIGVDILTKKRVHC